MRRLRISVWAAERQEVPLQAEQSGTSRFRIRVDNDGQDWEW